LNEAHRKGVVIFASASNNGLNEPISFPARMDNIFCIGATDGLGNRSPFTTPQREIEMFATLGEQVTAALDLDACRKDHSSKREDGTSVATPIAAGIASLLLDLLRQAALIGPGSKPQSNRDIIRKLFLAMSKLSMDTSYRYLAPWSLIQSHISSREARKDLFVKEIERVLRNPPGIRQ
jgi:hypothetical protein